MGKFTSASIICSVIFIVLSVTIEPFRDFFFISMYGEKKIVAPSLFNILISFATFGSVLVTALYVRKQIDGMKSDEELKTQDADSRKELAQANKDQAAALQTQSNALLAQAIELKIQNEKTEENNLQARFLTYVKLMNPENDDIDWEIGLSFLKTLAINSPSQFSATALKSLASIGNHFSMAGKTNFVIEIFKAISDIIEHTQELRNKNIQDALHIHGFVIPRHENNKILGFRMKDFTNIYFSHCDFGGVVFMNCNFHKTWFLKVKDVELKGCLLSGGQARPESNFFWNEDQFTISQTDANYIWDNDLGNLKKRPKVIDNAFHTPLLSEQYLSTWDEGPFETKMDIIIGIDVDMEDNRT